MQTKDVKCVSILKTSHMEYRKETAFERMHDMCAHFVKGACEKHFHGQKASLVKVLT